MTNEYYPINAGGIGMLVEQAVAELSQLDPFEITVILIGSIEFVQGVKDYGKAHYEDVVFIGEQDMLNAIDSSLALPEWAFTFGEYYTSNLIAEYLLKVSSTDPFDLVEFPDYKGVGYVTLKHKRLRNQFPSTHFVVRIHGATVIWNQIDGVDVHSRERLHLYMMERYSLEHSDSWTLPSRALAEQYVDLLGVEYKQLNIVTPIFKKLGSHKSYLNDFSRDEKKQKVFFYGKQQHVKGLDIFLEAAIAVLEDTGGDQSIYEFIVVGQDTENQWSGGGKYGDLQRRMIPDHLSAKIQFTGRIDMATLPEFVGDMACAVIPSRMETFCLAAHELNWLGVPLILNQIPAFVEYFKNRESCLYFDGSVDHLKQVIVSACEDQKVREQLAENCNAEMLAQKASTSNLECYGSLIQAQVVEREAESSSKSPLVSIIVPYYNEMRLYLKETLASIEATTYERKEVIIVNDGSSDPIANETFQAIAGSYQSKPQFRFLEKRNGGLGSARNFGIQEASGEYILPLDSDDLIERDFLDETVAALELNPELDAVSTYTSFFRDGSDARKEIDYVIPYDLDALLIFAENRAGVATSLFRKKLFDEFSYSEVLPAFEDWDFWMQLAESGKKSEVLPRLLFRYRRREGSMVSAEGFSRKAQLMHFIGNRHKKHLKAHGDSIFKVFNQLNCEALDIDKNQFPHAKIYLAPGGVFSEENSIYHRYELEQAVDLEIRLPRVERETVLRFDPSAVPSSVHVFHMSLHKGEDMEVIWSANTDNHFDPVSVGGDARRIKHPNCLLLSCSGNDPYIICPDLAPSEDGYVLRVVFQVFDRFESILYEQTGKDFSSL